LADDIETFAEFFPDDYHTAYYGKWHLGDEVIKRRGWDEWHSIEDQYRVWSTKEDNNEILSDYHHYLISQGYKPDKESSGKMVFSRSFAAQLPEEHTKAAYLGRKVSEFIDHNKANPFAICVNFFEPHPPYTGPFDDLYEPDDIPQTPVFRVDPPDNASRMSTLMADDQAKKRLVINQDQETSILEADDAFNGPQNNSEKEFRRVQAKYYGLVTLMDKAVGQILDAIEKAEISEETIVVFTSEHGDQMGDHNFFHKIVMYEQSTKVPMLVRIPWLESYRIKGRYSHIDTIPTLLELMGQKIPDHLQGQSRMKDLETKKSLEENDVYLDWNGRSVDQTFPLSELERMREIPHRCVITGDGWKLNLSVGDQSELYDLNSDPYEQVNLYDNLKFSGKVLELAHKIRNWQLETGDTALIPEVYPGVGFVEGMR